MATTQKDVFLRFALNQQEFQRTKAGIEGLGAGVGRLKTILGTLGVGLSFASVGLLTKRSMESIDALAKQADMLDTTTEALGTYQVAASLAGIEPEKFGNALRKMITNLGDARDGTGEAAETLKRLGLNVNELVGMRADKQFEAIAEKIGGLATQADKANAAARIFGERDGVKMLNLINEMGPGTEDLRRKLDAMGVTFSRIDAAKVEVANDAMELAGQSAVGLGNTIAVAVSPFIEQMANKWIDAAVAAGGFKDTVQHGMMAVSTAVGVGADAIRGLQVVLKGIEVVAFGAASAINLMLAPLLNPAIVDASVDGLRKARSELGALLDAPMPSEGIRERFFEIIEGADRAATAIAKAKKAAGGDSVVAPLEDPKAAKAAEKEAEALQKIIDKYDTVGAAQRRRTADLIALNEAAARGDERAIEALNLIASGIENVEDVTSDAEAALDEFAKQAARNMQDIVAGFLRGEMAGKSFIRSLIDGLADLAAQLAAQALLRQLFGAMAGSTNPALAGLGRLFGGGLAAGGPVRGPGGPTDDRVPAMLSNGEYVVQASAVRKWGQGFLDFINRGMPVTDHGVRMAYATGGIVGAVSHAKPASRPVIIAPVYHIDASGGTSAAQVMALQRVLQENNRALKADATEAKIRKF